ncbi:MAG: SH3 domain-containing protein [Chloroflexi bacterium]|nr:SH3 domain-containing protein [Chloroflexota bacterium]
MRWLVLLLIVSVFFVGCGSGNAETEATKVVLPTPTQHAFFADATADVEVTATATLVILEEIPTASVPAPVVMIITVTPAPTTSPTPSPTVTLTPTPQPMVRILYQLVNLRGGPGINYEVVGILREGEIATVMALDPLGLWYKVESSEGVQGWLSVNLAIPVDEFSLTAVPIIATLPALPEQTETAVPPTP